MISRRWAELLRGPGPWWEEVEIWDWEWDADAVIDPRAMAAWFSRRAGSIRLLVLWGNSQRLPSRPLGAMLLSQAASLRELVIDCSAFKLSGSDLSGLKALTGLEMRDRCYIIW